MILSTKTNKENYGKAKLSKITAECQTLNEVKLWSVVYGNAGVGASVLSRIHILLLFESRIRHVTEFQKFPAR